jgi:hypothetical protein
MCRDVRIQDRAAMYRDVQVQARAGARLGRVGCAFGPRVTCRDARNQDPAKCVFGLRETCRNVPMQRAFTVAGVQG